MKPWPALLAKATQPALLALAPSAAAVLAAADSADTNLKAAQAADDKFQLDGDEGVGGRSRRAPDRGMVSAP